MSVLVSRGKGMGKCGRLAERCMSVSPFLFSRDIRMSPITQGSHLVSEKWTGVDWLGKWERLRKDGTG